MKSKKNKNNLNFFVFIICFVLAIIYSLVTLYSIGWLSEFIVLWPLVSIVAALRDYSIDRVRDGGISDVFLGYLLGQLLGVMVVVSLLISGFGLIRFIFDSLIEAARLSSPIVIAVCVLFGGLLLFKIRERFRSCYGVTEIVVGMSIAGYKIPQSLQIEETFIIAITGGLYLVVRGLDNVRQGKGSDLFYASGCQLFTKFMAMSKNVLSNKSKFQ